MSEPIKDAVFCNSYIHTNPPAEDCPARFDIEAGDFEELASGKQQQCPQCFPDDDVKNS